VSAELADRFVAAFGPDVVVRMGGALHLDLVHAVRHTLRSCGVPAAQIEVLDACTSCDQERYFSHRRDRGQTGRHLGFVACRFL
jgi:copper oxidase (laccase) domain-containing protein